MNEVLAARISMLVPSSGFRSDTGISLQLKISGDGYVVLNISAIHDIDRTGALYLCSFKVKNQGGFGDSRALSGLDS